MGQSKVEYCTKCDGYGWYLKTINHGLPFKVNCDKCKGTGKQEVDGKDG